MTVTLPPNHSEAAIELLKFPKFGKGIGLHRMLWLIDQMKQELWWRNLDVLKVTGSKGKGSTSALCSSILSRLGLQVGLFTSPHLLRFNERINLAGKDISDEDLTKSWTWFRNIAAAYRVTNPSDSFGAFEAFTAVAFEAFARHNLAAVVCEAGIGGRYDSTRPLPGKTVALTSIELEHAELLGSTTEQIAYDKADLCPSGGTLVVGRLDRELIRRLKGYCRIRSVSLLEVELQSDISDVHYVDHRMEFTLSCIGLNFGRVSTPLLGEHQAGNVAVAIAATWDWLSRNRPDIHKERFKASVIEGIAGVHWPGRLQRIMENPDIVIDVGHTPQSMRSIASTVQEVYPGRPIALLTGVSKDKNVKSVLSELAPLASAIICTRPYHKGAPANEVADICRQLRPEIEVIAKENIEEAVNVAINYALPSNMVILVAGGLFLAIEAMVAIQGGDPSVLKFA
jgi:dihydrofolate synthase/folylpolyglutamate synthase